MRKIVVGLSFLLLLFIVFSAIPSFAEENRSITITSKDQVVYIAKKLKLTGTVEKLADTAPAKTTLVWSSSDKTIAKIDQLGNVTGVKVGEVTITCSSKDDPTISAEITITVRQQVKSITLDSKTMSLLLTDGEEKIQSKIEYTIMPENAFDKSVFWSSSDETVATVDQDGLVTAVSVGKAVISAKPNDPSVTKAVTCTVTVKQAVTSITVESASQEVYVGSSLKLSAQVLPETSSSKKVTWSSSDPKILSVDSTGKAVGKKSGQVTVTCSAADGSEKFATIEISVYQKVKSLTLSDKTTTLLLGADEDKAKITLVPAISPSDAHYQGVVFSSSDEAVAKVDETGLVTAVSAGKATITAASSEPGATAKTTCIITVGEAVSKVTIESAGKQVDKGKTLKMKAQVLPAGVLNQKVTWSSSNEKIATVSAAGVVTAKGVGEVTITATAADGSGMSASTNITVIQKAKTLTLDTKRIVLFEDKTKTAYVKVMPADTSNKKVLWESSNTYVAIVDNSGKITAKNAGDTTITVKTLDGSGKKASLKVIVEPINPISLESIAFGRYLPNLLGLTVRNRSSTISFRDFDFDMELYSINGTKIDSGSYSLGKDVPMGPKTTKTIKRNVWGVGMAYKVVITITGVQLKDGSFYSIPRSEQETWSFTRR